MSQPSITLYLSPGACSLAPHILLHEVGIPFDTVKLSTRSGLPAHFAKINPKKRVPVLVLDGKEIITEVPAILTAIAHLAPKRHLLGKTPLETVRAYEWMNYLSGTLHGQGFGCLWRPARFSDDMSLLDGIRAKGRKTIEECFELVETRLNGAHAVGEDFSVVDAYLYVFWRWGSEVGVEMGRFPKYGALVRGMIGMESVKVTLKVEGIPSFVDSLLADKRAKV